jgi:hypothetical protein
MADQDWVGNAKLTNTTIQGHTKGVFCLGILKPEVHSGTLQGELKKGILKLEVGVPTVRHFGTRQHIICSVTAIHGSTFS